MQHLTIWDLVWTPIYLIVLTLIAKKFRDSHYPKGHSLRRYFLPGLFLKFLGAIFIALIYQFVYSGGDTFNFFEHSKIINSSLDDSISTWIKLLLRTNPDKAHDIYPYVSQMYWYYDPSTYTVSIIGALFGLLNGTSYIPIALLFAFFSYSGMWAMYRTFINLYPKLHKQLAIAFLFIPSTFVWGSGMFKDTVCMFGLGWMTYTTFRIFINKDFSIRNIFMLVFCFYLISIIKLYILLAFLPALTLWLMMTYSKRIRITPLRWGVNLAFIALTIGGFLFFTQRFSADLDKYSLENISKTAEVTRGWITYVSEREGGSIYDLGDYDGSIGGMLSKFPAAVVVTLFRPFPWEANKPLVLLSALEALLFVFFTIMILIKTGIFRSARFLLKDPNLLFCLIFSLIFAFSVGITSYNFGTLSRYKIPCLPFYGAFLAILYYYGKMKSNPAEPVKNLSRVKVVRPAAATIQ